MITVKQYKIALNKLSTKQFQILHKLYEIEPVENSVKIAEELGYKNWGAVNLQIGKIGKEICSILGIKPDLTNYNTNILSGGFFIVIHRQYHNKGTYWDMEPNLRKAIEEIDTQKKITQYYVQYHNADVMNYFPGTDKNKIDAIKFDSNIQANISFFTKKRLVENAIDQYSFIIAGTGNKNKQYYLWSFLKIEKITKDKDYYTASGAGLNFSSPILLNHLSGFENFKKFCGNFGIGFQNITKHDFCNTLLSFANEVNLSKKLTVKTFEEKEVLTDLIKKLNKRMMQILPQKRNIEIEQIIRNDRQIVSLLKQASNYKCQFPNCDAEIKTKTGLNYVEVAHVKPVKGGGQSVLGNLLVLCPNHHKEFDYGELKIYEQTLSILSGKLNEREFFIEIFN
jgi:predicted HNH restriction endonuclease